MLLPLMLISQIATADCSTTMRLCDKALEDAQNLVFEQGKQIANYQDKSNLQNKIIEDQKSQLDSPLRNPYYIAGGTVITVLALELLLGGFRK